MLSAFEGKIGSDMTATYGQAWPVCRTRGRTFCLGDFGWKAGRAIGRLRMEADGIWRASVGDKQETDLTPDWTTFAQRTARVAHDNLSRSLGAPSLCFPAAHRPVYDSARLPHLLEARTLRLILPRPCKPGLPGNSHLRRHRKEVLAQPNRPNQA